MCAGRIGFKQDVHRVEQVQECCVENQVNSDMCLVEQDFIKKCDVQNRAHADVHCEKQG